MDIPDGVEQDTIAADTDTTSDAPWGINPKTNKPWTKSPEEREAFGARMAAARAAKATTARPELARGPQPEDPELAPVDRAGGDREPGRGRRRGKAKPADAKAPEPEIPPFRAGPIAKSVNKLYAKAGRLVRLVNPVLGQGIIACTRKDDEDDTTVGEAWEELARVNPKWRARLMRLTAGGAWAGLFWAHAPIVLALLMLESVRNWMPFPDLIGALVGDEDQDPAPGPVPDGTPFGADMTDLGSMMAMASQMAAQMMGPAMAGRMAPPGPRAPEPPAAEDPAA